MMKVITIANQKGGCGKTTVAVNLALNLALEDLKITLIDTDPQRSAYETLNSRHEEPICEVAVIEENVHQQVAQYEDYDFAIIDTPPHNQKIIRAAIICADLVIVPVQDSPLDIRSADQTIKIIKEAQSQNEVLRAFFLLSRIQPNTILARDLKRHLRKIYKDIPILKSELRNRVVYKQSIIYGKAITEYEKMGAASEEVEALTKEILEKFNIKTA